MSAIRYRYRSGYTWGGYSGKARRNRDRSRAARFDVQQMLDEFDEPGEAGPDRYIPIGRCSEFLPSAGVENEELTLHDSGSQPALPFETPKMGGPEPVAETAIRMTPQAKPRVNNQVGQGSLLVERRPQLPPITASQPAQPSAITDRPGAKTLAGLLYGGAIGSAAAAALLLVLRLAIL